VPKAFRRNYSITSIGSARREAVERYLLEQLGHHGMADPDVQARLEQFQIVQPRVDLSTPEHSAHGLYVYNLHIVLVHDGRGCDVRPEALATTRGMILGVTGKKGYRLSAASILSDHIRLTLGCVPAESPREVALCYMNNIAFAHGMRAIFSSGFYTGTFGEYDLGAVRQALL
jgi:hypothetical protein